MIQAFDQIAADYDVDFTESATGKLQRNMVWHFLEKELNTTEPLKILELNCGTGEDAIWLAKKGHSVLSTDISKEMLEVAKAKCEAAGLGKQITFSMLDISSPGSYPDDMKFDFIFSNFGGFNCVPPEVLKEIFPKLNRLLVPNGCLTVVVMSKFCLWESIYFLAKGRFSKTFRRNRKTPLKVPVGNRMVETWYYSPADIAHFSGAGFKTKKVQPIGFFLPPSYLDHFFSRHRKLLTTLNGLEKNISKSSFFAPFSDHYIIEMEAIS